MKGGYMEQHLSQYKIFYEVAKAGNISRAAKGLYISQPAISKSISKLEESLNVTLFVRNSRGVTLTMEGQMLYNHISDAFHSISIGEQQLRRIKDFHIGKIKIGVSNTLCKYTLLPKLKDFVVNYPHIMVNIASQPTAQTVNMVDNGLLDLGLVVQPNNKKNFAFAPLMDIHDTFVASPEYLNHLYLRESIECDPLLVGNIMMLDKKNTTRRYIDEYLLNHNISPHQLLEVTNMELLIEFTKIGIGIGCVIREFVEDELNQGSLVEIRLPHSIPNRTIGFYYSIANPNPALKSFL